MSKIIQLKDGNGNDIYPKSAKNIITASLTNNTSVTSNNRIPIDKVDAIVGNKLTLNNNKIVIGSGINYVKVSAMLSVQYNASNTIYSGQIRLNSEDILIMRFWTYKSSTHVNSATSTTILLKVKEGDVIDFTLRDNSAVIRPETSITVEEVL